jgi:NAD(P)H-nitrite reductase large subunit
MSDKDDDLVICRCEEVTRGEILQAIEMGARTLWQIRRLTRAGMGLCQGRSCEQLAAAILAEALEQPIEEVLKPSYRPPLSPIQVDILGSGERIELVPSHTDA